MKVFDPEQGKSFELYPTAELERDLVEWGTDACPHTSSQVVIATYSNGSKHFVPQCQLCGDRIGNSIKKSDAPVDAPQEDTTLRLAYEKVRTGDRQQIFLKHLKIQLRGESSFSTRYQEYLQSPQWKVKRQKVLERDRSKCQGCLERTATQVHHLTYQHVFDELLFELVAMCESCHQKCHPADELEEFFPFGDESPCDGCRWQSEGDNGREICFAFEIPASRARGDEALCGSKRLRFEPLK